MGIFPTIGFTCRISPYLLDYVPLLIGREEEEEEEEGLFRHFLLQKYILLHFSFPF